MGQEAEASILKPAPRGEEAPAARGLGAEGSGHGPEPAEGSPLRENGTSGSVQGRWGNWPSYRDSRLARRFFMLNTSILYWILFHFFRYAFLKAKSQRSNLCSLVYWVYLLLS